MNKKFRRVGAVLVSAALTAGALALFAGCTTDHPEVSITYTFNKKDYVVEYELSRTDAPQTVQHFIELADAGFYDGTCIHDYTATALYGGGYRLVDAESGEQFSYADDNSLKSFELYEIPYFTTVQELEDTKKMKFTQSVWMPAADSTSSSPKTGDGLYTVYGEQKGKVSNQYGRDYSHRQGALVMYYTEKGSGEDVIISRADKGKDNHNQPLQYEDYLKNSATSLFYTYTGASTNSELEKNYCVFGMAKNYDDQLKNGLLQAIADYTSEQTDEDEAYDFTTTQENVRINRYEPFKDLQNEGRLANFETPITMPIIIKSVKVTKY